MVPMKSILALLAGLSLPGCATAFPWASETAGALESTTAAGHSPAATTDSGSSPTNSPEAPGTSPLSEPDRGTPIENSPTPDAASPRGTGPSATALPGVGKGWPDDGSLHGIDVSHHQGDIDWVAVREAGIQFVFAKATEGNTFIDPLFAINWQCLKEAGLYRGAYHFFHPDVDPILQAEHFIANVQLEPGDLPPALDIEVSDGAAVKDIDKNIQIWLDRVTEEYGVRPMIYSGLNFLTANLAEGFGAYPLWIADYVQEIQKIPGDWQTWTLWQNTDNEIVKGIEGPVDRSIHHGPQSRWEHLLVPLAPQ